LTTGIRYLHRQHHSPDSISPRRATVKRWYESIRTLPEIRFSIETAGLAAGAYILQVISVNGDVELREDVTVPPDEGLQRTLDLGRFATGYYVVRIESGEGILGTWPIIITH